MISFILYGVLAVAAYYVYMKFTRRKLPPGPIPLPFVGNLIEVAALGGTPYGAMAALAKKYGNVMSLQMGVVPHVVVSGTDTIKAFLKTEDYDSRLSYDWILDRSYGQRFFGLLFSQQFYWKENRRISVKLLKEYGFGKKSTMESIILDEFEEFINDLKEDVQKDEIVFVDTVFNGPMANVMWSLVTGTRFNLKDPEFLKLTNGVNDFMKAGQVGGCNLLGAFPFLCHYLPGLTGYTHLQKVTSFVVKYFENLVKEYRERGDYKHTAATNLIDGFLQEIDNNKNPDNPIYTDRNLVCIVSDLFLGGSETSGNWTAQAIRLMVQYPEIQMKIQEELDRVIEKGKLVTWEDKPKLRYTDATILEILRFAPVAPFGPRRADETVRFGPYEIPKDTSVLVNYYTATRDESVWGDPENFRPERFLNDKGDLVNTEKAIVFGTGRRNCVGEVQARIATFLALSNILHTFKLGVDPKSGMPGVDVLPGFTVSPKPFKMRVTLR